MLGKQYGKATSMGYKHQLYTVLEEKVFFLLGNHVWSK